MKLEERARRVRLHRAVSGAAALVSGVTLAIVLWTSTMGGALTYWPPVVLVIVVLIDLALSLALISGLKGVAFVPPEDAGRWAGRTLVATVFGLAGFALGMVYGWWYP